MKTFEYTCKATLGLHARPSAILALECNAMKSSVTVESNGKTANGTNALELIALRAGKGDVLKITVDGEGDTEQADYDKLQDVFAHIIPEDNNLNIMNVAFFGTKDYDKIYFDELSKDLGDGAYNAELTYFNSRLTSETVHLSEGFDAVCIFVNDEAPRDVVEQLAKNGVRLILLRCAGFNNVDLDAAKECGITVLRVPAYSPYAVAEHAMAILQAANRRLHKAYNKVKDNNFALNGLLGTDLHNKVAGIVTTGRIGECMARICKGYGMTVIAWDKFPKKSLEEEGLLTYVSKEELFQKADLISLHGPLITGEGGTFHLIDAKAIAMMKDDVMLVNTARGGFIDTEALIASLKTGKFHAVALDVYEGQDEVVYTDHSDDVLSNDVVARLTSFPQVFVTSHQAFFTREALQAIAADTMENARNFQQGMPYGIAEVVDPRK